MKKLCKVLVGLALIAVALSGCQKGEGNQASKTELPPSQIPNPGETVEPVPETKTTPNPPKTTTEEPKKIELPPIIKPGTEGWASKPTQAAEIGTKIDQALRNLNGAWVDSRIIVSSPSVQGSAQAIGRFKDPRNFYAEYFLPADPTRVSLARADGSGAKVSEGGKTLEANAAPTVTVGSFAKDFTRALVTPIAVGATPWRDLLSAWNRGEGGYKLIIEEKAYEVQGRQMRIVRLIAETKKAPSTRIEIRLDGIRNVPVSIRVDQQTAEGAASSQWSGGWRFGQTIDLSPEGLAKSRPPGQQ